MEQNTLLCKYKMNSQHIELYVYELYLYNIKLSREQETIEFDHSIRIDDLFNV